MIFRFVVTKKKKSYSKFGWGKLQLPLCLLVLISFLNGKVGKILKGSMDSISSPLPSVKIQIMGRKDCLRRKGKSLLGIVNKHLPADT